MGRNPRLGVTLLELLVVIGIITVLVALLIPAVTHVAEGQRRGQCANNLRQLGVALEGYHSAHSAYPSGATPILVVSGVHQNSSVWSAHTMLLPYIGELSLYDSMNLDLGPGSDAAYTAPRTVVRAFLCPSQRHITNFSDVGVNYAASAGTLLYRHNGPADITAQRKRKNIAGPFQYAASMTERDVQDGHSKTIAMVEISKTEYETEDRDPAMAFVTGAAWPGCDFGAGCSPQIKTQQAGFRTMVSQLESILQTGAIGSDLHYWKGLTWASAFPMATIGHTILPPNSPVPDGGANGICRDSCMNNLRSNHPGGAHALMLDGSVRFLSNSIEESVLWGAGSIAGSAAPGIDGAENQDLPD